MIEQEAEEAEENEDAWKDFSEDSCSESSDGEWINVNSDDDGKNLKIDISDDEESQSESGAEDKDESQETKEKRVPIEQRRILTPQDFKLINEKKLVQSSEALAGLKRKPDRFVPTFITAF